MLPHTLARRALSAYGIAPDAEVALISTSENATFRVDHGGSRYALRVHRDGYHSRDAIESEHAWIDALRDHSVVDTPAVVRTLEGESVVDVDGPYVSLFEWVDGAHPEDDTHWFAEIGAVSARLHAHARSWTSPAQFTRMTWGFAEHLGPDAPWGRWQDSRGLDASATRLLDRCVTAIEARTNEFGRGRDRFGLIHSDLRAANLVVTDDVVTVIDFDDCGFGWYLADLAASLSFVEDRPDAPELIDAWLTGYRTIAPVGREEESMVPTFVAMRRIQLTAWIASHPDADTARALGAQFTSGTLALAERYLTDTA